MLDKDGNGYVDRKQLEDILKGNLFILYEILLFIENGMFDINGKLLEEIINSCDKDRNGCIDYNQFRVAMEE